MKYVIAYDLADDRRRSRLVSLLLDYGARIQESVFYADLEEHFFSEMMERAGRLIEPELDVMNVFPLCAACVERKAVVGKGRVPEYKEFYIV